MLDRLKTLSAPRKLALAGAIAALLLVLLVAAWSLLHIPYRPLFTRLRTADAAAIVAEFDRRKTPYRLADDGTTILVPADRAAAARLDVARGNPAMQGDVGFELFNKSDMGLTDLAQRINYQRALQGELERTIMTLDGVDTARVHLSLGEDRVFREDRVAPKASVTIHMRTGAMLGAEAAAGVQRLVAAAVPQLDAGNVVILDARGQAVSAAPAPAGGASPAQDEGERAVGDYYADRVRAALRSEFPDGAIGVAVRAIRLHAPSLPSGTDSAPRDFPLQVTLDPQPSVDADGRQTAQGIAAGAIEFDSSRGDAIAFGSLAPPPPPPLARHEPLPHVPDPVPARAAVDRSGAFTWAAPALGMLVLLTLLALGWLRTRSRPLSAAQQDRLAARLRHLLAGEEVEHA